MLTASFPSSTTTWECRGKDHGVAGPAAITAFVVGIRPKRAGIQLPLVRITTATSTVSSHPDVVASGVPGWIVTGGGALASSADPTGWGDLLTASYPVVVTGTSIPMGWRAVAKDHAVASPGTVQAFAVSLGFPVAAEWPVLPSGPAPSTFCVSFVSPPVGLLAGKSEQGKCLPGYFEGLSFNSGIDPNTATGAVPSLSQLLVVKIKKAWSAASPSIFMATVQNRLLSQVTIVFFRRDPVSGQDVVSRTIALRNAVVMSINYTSDARAGASAPATETITLGVALENWVESPTDG